MAHSHRMPRRKVELEVEVARLMLALREARTAAEELREQKAALIEQHHSDLLRMRYRVIGEQLGQRILDRVDAEVAALADAAAVPTPVIVESPSRSMSPDLIDAHPAAHIHDTSPASTAISIEDTRALEILTAQVADLQQRLTDAQRTIETLVTRVLDLAGEKTTAGQPSRTSTSETPLHAVTDTDATVHTLRFRLTGSDD